MEFSEINYEAKESTDFDSATINADLSRAHSRSFSAAQHSNIQVSDGLGSQSPAKKKGGSFLEMLAIRGAQMKAEKELQEVLTQWQSTENFLRLEVRVPTFDRPKRDILQNETGIESWRSIVKEKSCLMNKRHCEQQEAIWELFTSELQHIRNLEIIRDFFMAAFEDLERRSFSWFQCDTKKIFGNVEELLEANQKFLSDCLRPVLETADGGPLDATCTSLYEGFMNIEEYFQPYLTFCGQYNNLSKYFKSQKDEYFAKLMEWFRTQPASARLGLSSWLMKPVQRLTKYLLLLNTIWKNTDDPSQRFRLQEMINKMENFVYKINAKVRETEENEALDIIYSRITDYEIFENVTKEVVTLLKQYSDVEPHLHRNRRFVREFTIKIKRVHESVRRMDGAFLIFSDVVLLCRKSNRKPAPSTTTTTTSLKICRAPISLRKIRMHPLREPGSFLLVILGEFETVTDAQIIYADNPAQMDSLIACVQEAAKKLDKMSTTLTVDRNPQNIIVDFDATDANGDANSALDFANEDETSTDPDPVPALTAEKTPSRPQLLRMRSVSSDDVGPKKSNLAKFHTSRSFPSDNSFNTNRSNSLSDFEDSAETANEISEETEFRESPQDLKIPVAEPLRTKDQSEVDVVGNNPATTDDEDQQSTEILENSNFVSTHISPPTTPLRRRGTPRFVSKGILAHSYSTLLKRQHAFRNARLNIHKRNKRHLTDTVACGDLDHRSPLSQTSFRTRTSSWSDNESRDDRNNSPTTSKSSSKNTSSDSFRSTSSDADNSDHYSKLTSRTDQMESSYTSSSGYGSPELDLNTEHRRRREKHQTNENSFSKDFEEAEEKLQQSDDPEENRENVLEDLFSVGGVEKTKISGILQQDPYENSASINNSREEDKLLVLSSDELEETYI